MARERERVRCLFDLLDGQSAVFHVVIGRLCSLCGLAGSGMGKYLFGCFVAGCRKEQGLESLSMIGEVYWRDGCES